VRRCYTDGVLPIHSSYGVLPPAPLDVDLLSTYTAVATASPPERVGETFSLEHAPRCPHHILVPSLNDTILCRSVRRGELPLHAQLREVLLEVVRREFAPTIGTQGT
jgi:hypothetical protein